MKGKENPKKGTRNLENRLKTLRARPRKFRVIKKRIVKRMINYFLFSKTISNREDENS